MSESDICERQILTSKDIPPADRFRRQNLPSTDGPRTEMG